MSLIIATGSNIGDKTYHLTLAKKLLCSHFKFIAESRIYQSDPVDYLDQDFFLNQILEFDLPNSLSALRVFEICQQIEKQMGRIKIIDKGPRNIDIDLIFWGIDQFNFENLIIPHPRWNQRSFVVYPLSEIPYYQVLKKHFKIPITFNNQAIALP